jgi:hypothetical protein
MKGVSEVGVAVSCMGTDSRQWIGYGMKGGKEN